MLITTQHHASSIIIINNSSFGIIITSPTHHRRSYNFYSIPHHHYSHLTNPTQLFLAHDHEYQLGPTTFSQVKQHKTRQPLPLHYGEWRLSCLQFLPFAQSCFQVPPYDCPYIFPFFDFHVFSGFRNPIWTGVIRRMTWPYVQNIKATILIHQMRHTILQDFLLKNIVITLQVAMQLSFKRIYAKDARMS